MFAVVARTLGCPHCEAAAHQLLLDEGLGPHGHRQRLGDASLSPAWRNAKPAFWPGRATRCTTRPSSIQQKTRALGAELGPDALLEAIGVASLANGTVRLAMLLE